MRMYHCALENVTDFCCTQNWVSDSDCGGSRTVSGSQFHRARQPGIGETSLSTSLCPAVVMTRLPCTAERGWLLHIYMLVSFAGKSVHEHSEYEKPSGIRGMMLPYRSQYWLAVEKDWNAENVSLLCIFYDDECHSYCPTFTTKAGAGGPSHIPRCAPCQLARINTCQCTAHVSAVSRVLLPMTKH